MKKLVAAMLSLLLLTGCGLAERDRAKVQESVSSDFTTTAELNYHGVDATMTILGQGAEKRYTLAFTQPASLAGMEMEFTKEKATLRYKDLSFSVDPASLTDGMAGQLLFDALESALGEDSVTITNQDGVLSVAGETSGGSFVLRLDKETGNFLSLEIPEEEFSLSFHGFSFY